MYSVGDYLVHPGQGVCQVRDVTSGPQAVYQLLPIGKRHPVHISFPVANEGRLRPVLSLGCGAAPKAQQAGRREQHCRHSFYKSSHIHATSL